MMKLSCQIRVIALILFFLTVSLPGSAQEYTMIQQGDVTLDALDLDAKATSPVYDQNDELCALIKVTLLGDWINPLQLETGMVGVMAREEKETGEVWFWVPYQARNLSFKCKGYEPLNTIPVRLERGKVFRLRIVSRIGAIQSSDPLDQLFRDMVLVKGGTFQMGATPEQGSKVYADELPVHTVTLDDFCIGKYEVTQAQWMAVMGNNPSAFKGENRPVDNVSWEDVQQFIRKLNDMTGYDYRLPTEAEWEYAARGGQQSKSYQYAGDSTLKYVAWYEEIARKKTHDVGMKSPNELGLYDMSGNVWEWCQDRYATYEAASQINPVGEAGEARHILRGGSWGSESSICRVSFRGYNQASSRRSNYGFRLVLEP